MTLAAPPLDAARRLVHCHLVILHCLGLRTLLNCCGILLHNHELPTWHAAARSLPHQRWAPGCGSSLTGSVCQQRGHTALKSAATSSPHVKQEKKMVARTERKECTAVTHNKAGAEPGVTGTKRSSNAHVVGECGNCAQQCKAQLTLLQRHNASQHHHVNAASLTCASSDALAPRKP